MSHYLLIASRAPFENAEVQNNYAIACSLSKEGNQTILVQVQNGVFAARAASKLESLSKLLQCGVNIVCDDFSPKERGISELRIALRSDPSIISSNIWPPAAKGSDCRRRKHHIEIEDSHFIHHG